MNLLTLSLFLVLILGIVLVFLLGLKLRGNPRAPLWFSFITFFYSLIPFLWFVYWNIFVSISELGSSILLGYPPFWPVLFTQILTYMLFGLFGGLFGIDVRGFNLETTTYIINILAWGIIGYIVGKLISKAKKKRKLFNETK